MREAYNSAIKATKGAAEDAFKAIEEISPFK